MEAIAAVLVLGAVLALLRWLFPGRPGEEIRSRQVVVSRGDETESLTIIEVLSPLPVEPVSAPEVAAEVPPHHAHDAGHSHHAHDGGHSHHAVDGGSFDGGGGSHH